MIKSQIRYDESVQDRSTDQTVRFLSVLAVVTAICSLFITGTVSGPVELFLWRPIMFGVAALSVAGWVLSRGLADRMQVWVMLGKWLILALIFGGVMGLTGIWHMNSAPLPLGISQLGQFMITLGISVPDVGPDGMMRGFAWGIGIAVAVWSYRTNKDILRAVFNGVGTWLAAALIFVLPSIFLLLSVWLGGGQPSSDVQDAVREFSRLGMNSYWSNMQMVRWFTGFGDQLSSSVMLFSASWVFVAAVAVSAVFFRSKILSAYRSIKIKRWTWFILAPIAGLVAGWSRAPWSDLDMVVWFIFLVISVLLIVFAVGRRDSRIDQGQPSLFALVVIALGSGLLGWPVLLASCACIALALLRPRSNVNDGPWTEIMDLVFLALSWVSLAVLALLFMRRGNLLDLSMLRMVLALLALSLPSLTVLFPENPSLRSKIWSMGFWLAGGALSAVLLASFAPFALVLLATAVCFVLVRAKPVFYAWLPSLILIYALAVFVGVVVVPRWINPKLLPL